MQSAHSTTRQSNVTGPDRKSCRQSLRDNYGDSARILSPLSALSRSTLLLRVSTARFFGVTAKSLSYLPFRSLSPVCILSSRRKLSRNVVTLSHMRADEREARPEGGERKREGWERGGCTSGCFLLLPRVWVVYCYAHTPEIIAWFSRMYVHVAVHCESPLPRASDNFRWFYQRETAW